MNVGIHRLVRLMTELSHEGDEGQLSFAQPFDCVAAAQPFDFIADEAELLDQEAGVAAGAVRAPSLVRADNEEQLLELT